MLLYKQAGRVWITTPCEKSSVVASIFYISAGLVETDPGSSLVTMPTGTFNNSPDTKEKHRESWTKEPQQMEIECEL